MTGLWQCCWEQEEEARAPTVGGHCPPRVQRARPQLRQLRSLSLGSEGLNSLKGEETLLRWQGFERLGMGRGVVTRSLGARVLCGRIERS